MQNNHDEELQVPSHTTDGYVITSSRGESVCLSSGGDYSGMEFSEVDFSFITLCANFSKATFEKCRFNMTDLSGSNLSGATINECSIKSCAFMWTNSANLNVTNSSLADVRFYSANLQHAKFQSRVYDVKFHYANLSNAQFEECLISKSFFFETICFQTIFNDCTFAGTDFFKSNLRLSQFKVITIFGVKFRKCNLSGSTWTSVESTVGDLKFIDSDFTAAQFSMCDGPQSQWIRVQLFGVFMERCNWFTSTVTDSAIEFSTFVSVGWNQTKFLNVIFANFDASTIRLRYAKFNNCMIIDSNIDNSSWEFCDLATTETQNLTIENPNYCLGTMWHLGYYPTNKPNPINGSPLTQESE